MAKEEKIKNRTMGLTPLPDDTFVVFVLGGPGAGKGTQCAKLVEDFGFVHLSAGDLLRAEQNRPDSQYGDLIRTYIKEGRIVPMEITIALLHNAMKFAPSARFLIDGFPRAMDQALKFEDEVFEAKAVLYFECPEDELLKRLLKRGETSGRADDNIESIKKRFRTFTETSYPVIEYYDKKGIVKKVLCTKPIDDVYAETKGIFKELLAPRIKDVPYSQ
ncbi:bifunctional uridylate/adenylate kinase [Borealophlyctis nickersoniae]|nr:bifunctional uridylate/adenylate kinase [Borealophlyctis nickersoniae]